MSPQVTQTDGAAAPRTTGRTLVLFCAVAVLWLATRPYQGVVQDARFYMVEALRTLDPARFADDLYFKFGSQGSFSVFSHLYPPFVSHFGIGAAAMGFTIAGQILWVGALLCLARSLVGDRYLWLSAAVVIAMPSQYAFFSYGEFFVTPRLFAEALTMLALALLRSRPILTLVLLSLSASLHPLMTLPGVVAVYVYFALAQPLLWLALPAGALLAAALGWAHIQPFANLFQTIDPAWLAIIRIRSPQCLLTSWSSRDFFQIIPAFVWTGAAILMTAGRDRRFLAAIVVTGVAGLACTFLGSDLAHNVLITELQPWRAVWVLQLVSRICIPLVAGILLAKSSLAAERKADPFAITVLFTMGLILVTSVTRLAQNPYVVEFGYFAFALAIGALAVIAVQLLLRAPQHRHVQGILLGFVVVLACVALSAWDKRLAWTKFLESSAPPPSDLAALLPQNASVYWQGGAQMPWLRLRRASYFSCEQGTGVVFHRETAMSYAQRMKSFWPLRLNDLDPSDECWGLDPAQKQNRTRAGIENVCRQEPGLDYMALMAPIPGVRSRVWKSPVRFEDTHLVDGKPTVQFTDSFYIYSCSDLR